MDRNSKVWADLLVVPVVLQVQIWVMCSPVKGAAMHHYAIHGLNATESALHL